MNFSEILIIMAIALILFGPDDLPVIARTIGRFVYEIRKITSEVTKEFTNVVDSPSQTLNKAFEQTTQTLYKSRTDEKNEDKSGPAEQASAGKEPDEELLTYEEQESSSMTLQQDEIKDPLAELPSSMVSYEKKGTSR